MPREVTIEIGQGEYAGVLEASCAPETVRRIIDALPIESTVRTWGDEIYFEIPVDCGPENGRAVVDKGDLGYWPDGNCFCIFFGRTPASPSEDEIRPASPVNPIGQMAGIDGLKSHGAGERVVVRLSE